MTMLMEQQAKMECDEMAELILTFLTEKGRLDKSVTLEKTILANVNHIIKADINETKSLSNKVILKHKNVIEQLKLV